MKLSLFSLFILFHFLASHTDHTNVFIFIFIFIFIIFSSFSLIYISFPMPFSYFYIDKKIVVLDILKQVLYVVVLPLLTLITASLTNGIFHDVLDIFYIALILLSLPCITPLLNKVFSVGIQHLNVLDVVLMSSSVFPLMILTFPKITLVVMHDTVPFT